MLFFQAEDGIRDIGVTGVQTCALPICGQVCAPDYKSRNVRSVRYAAAASAMKRLNPQLRLGPTSRGCNLVSRASIVTELEKGVSKRATWEPSKIAIAHTAGLGPPLRGNAVFMRRTSGITCIPPTKPKATTSANAGEIGRAHV